MTRQATDQVTTIGIDIGKIISRSFSAIGMRSSSGSPQWPSETASVSQERPYWIGP